MRLTIGTPQGVSQLVDGQNVHAGLQLPGSSRLLAELRLQVKNRAGNFTFKP